MSSVLAPACVEFAAEVVCSVHFALYTTLDDRKGHDLTIEHGTARGVLLKAPGLDVPTRLIVPAPSAAPLIRGGRRRQRSEEHTSELQSLMRISYAVFCLKKKTNKKKS